LPTVHMMVGGQGISRTAWTDVGSVGVGRRSGLGQNDWNSRFRPTAVCRKSVALFKVCARPRSLPPLTFDFDFRVTPVSLESAPASARSTPRADRRAPCRNQNTFVCPTPEIYVHGAESERTERVPRRRIFYRYNPSTHANAIGRSGLYETSGTESHVLACGECCSTNAACNDVVARRPSSLSSTS
jgi:hypothetical protein